jgi:hypothetical protein
MLTAVDSDGFARQRLKQKFQEKEDLLQSYYEHGEFVGKKPICEQTPIGAIVYPGIVFNVLLLVVSSYLLVHFTWPTLSWMALCSVLSIQQARTFGREDKEL